MATFVVFGMLLGVLPVFVRQGYPCARVALSLAVVFRRRRAQLS